MLPGLADGVPSSDPPFLQDFIEKVRPCNSLIKPMPPLLKLSQFLTFKVI